TESMITTSTRHQALATGFPIGKRFKSARVQRSCDANFIHLGHEARADGRWRVYVFADRAAPTADASKVEALASWLESDPGSPLVAYRREGEDLDALIELSVIYQQEHTEFSFPDVPTVFRPHVGAFGLEYVEKMYASLPDDDTFADRRFLRRSLRARQPGSLRLGRRSSLYASVPCGLRMRRLIRSRLARVRWASAIRPQTPAAMKHRLPSTQRPNLSAG